MIDHYSIENKKKERRLFSCDISETNDDL